MPRDMTLAKPRSQGCQTSSTKQPSSSPFHHLHFRLMSTKYSDHTKPKRTSSERKKKSWSHLRLVKTRITRVRAIHRIRQETPGNARSRSRTKGKNTKIADQHDITFLLTPYTLSPVTNLRAILSTSYETSPQTRVISATLSV